MANGEFPIVESVMDKVRSPRGAGDGRGPLGFGVLGGSPLNIRQKVGDMIAGRGGGMRLGHGDAPAEGESYVEQYESARAASEREGAKRNYVFDEPTIP